MVKSLFFVALFTCVIKFPMLAQQKSFKSDNAPGEIKEEFTGFNSTDRVSLKVSAGDILFVNWKIGVKKGKVSVSLLNNKKRIWQKDLFPGNDTAGFYVPVTASGSLDIRIAGTKAEGAVLLFYRVAAEKKIGVKTNANLELFGIMMALDNAPDIIALKDSVEINGKKSTYAEWYALAIKNYYRYKSFDSCSLMQRYRQYMARGLYNDFFIAFLLQAPQVPDAKLTDSMDSDVILPFSAKGDAADARKEAAAFLDMFNTFYRDIQFDKYLRDYQPYYTRMVADVKKNLPPPEFIPVLENFYHKTFREYCLVPGLNILTSMGFGKTHHARNTIYNAFGPFGFMTFNPTQPDPGFDYPGRIANLSVHEFGHSFVNPAIDKLPAELLRSTERLYEPVSQSMKKQAYTTWTTCLYEHFVRAGEVIIARKMGRSAVADKMLNDNVQAGFIYLPFIVKELEVYDKTEPEKKEYDSFVLTIMEHLRDAKEFR